MHFTLIVYVSQESGHNLSKFSAFEFPRLKPRCQSELQSAEPWGSNQTHMVVGRIQFPVTVGLRPSASPGHTQLLAR